MKGIKTTSILVSTLGLGFVCLYLIAAIHPDAWWGLHSIAFFSLQWQVIVFALVLASILGFYFFADKIALPGIKSPVIKHFLFLTISAICGWVYYNLPMHKSLYGDAVMFREKMGPSTTENNDLFITSLLSPNVMHPKVGNITVLSAVRLMSFHYGMSHREAFRIIDAVSGVLFVLLWLWFISWYIENTYLKVTLYLIGLTAPFTQFFFGHEEIYSPAFPITAAYLMTLLAYFKTRKGWLLGLLPVLLFLCLKIHSVFILFVPAFILTLIFHFVQDKPKWLALFTWKNVSLWLLLPFTAFGTFAYFFVFKDYNDPRFVGDDVNIYERLFLPLLSPEPPYDRYTLLHFNHFFDYFNMIFLWSAAALFIIVGCLIFFRKHINWNKPELILTGFTMILFLMIFFAYNPLMSMPVDFDLFSLPGTTLLMLAVVMSAQVKENSFGKMIIGPALALSILAIPIFAVNADRQMLGYRMESLGYHVFKTYWIKSSDYLRGGIVLQSNDFDYRIEHLNKALEELEPYAVEGKDIEYANLVHEVAKIYRTQKQDLKTALFYHQRVLRYSQERGAYYIGLMDSAFRLGEYEWAYNYCQGLLKFSYPTQQKALRIAIDCAIMANKNEKALEYCNSYLSLWQDDYVAYVHSLLINGQNLDDLKQVITKGGQQ